MRRSNHAKKKANRKSNSSPDMDNNNAIKLQSRSTRPGLRFPRPKQPNLRSSFFFYASISLAILLFCYSLFFRISNVTKYGVVIDGGSTGTRIHVFKYEIRGGNSVFDFSERGLVSMRVNPGLSAYVDEPEGAGASVAHLVEFAKEHVPKEEWKETEVRLMATAGMRLLKGEDQGRILNACRTVLRGSGFQFSDDWATVISGSDEGLFAWVVANYALGSLGGEPAQTTGIIELGGASAQVTFVSNEPMPTELSRKVKFGNVTYNLYSHSLLHFGQNVAFESLKQSLIPVGDGKDRESLQRAKPMDPCTPSGYTHDKEAWKLSPISLLEKDRYLSSLLPSGNFTECRYASLKLLQKGQDSCSYQSCHIGSNFIPKLRGKFLATENFFHTSKFFGLREGALLSDLMVAGQNFCAEDWSKLKQKYASLEEEELARYCFSPAYIVALLHDSLGIALDDQRVGYANQVRDIPLDWALGAFILQNSYVSETHHSTWISTITGGLSSPLLIFCGIFLLIFMSWYVSKWRKPQLKTIYDLEKGKYIVTRVGRYS